jgi:hypothetical protein
MPKDKSTSKAYIATLSISEPQVFTVAKSASEERYRAVEQGCGIAPSDYEIAIGFPLSRQSPERAMYAGCSNAM